VTASYLPILMLMIISYASLFCKQESADLRIMMALTALLVLYALYQQISDGLPQTSYTKAVDIWCFFAITLIFSQVYKLQFAFSNKSWFTKIHVPTLYTVYSSKDQPNILELRMFILKLL